MMCLEHCFRVCCCFQKQSENSGPHLSGPIIPHVLLVYNISGIISKYSDGLELYNVENVVLFNKPCLIHY